MSRGMASTVMKLLDLLMALALGLMAIMVFGNVVLRYGFNSGIVESEDLSRFLFVWLCFVGAVVAMKEHTHLGMDSLVAVLPHKAKVACAAVSHVLMIVVLAMLLWGCLQQMKLNSGISALGAVPYPLSWVYAAGVFCSGGCLVIVIPRLFMILAGRVADDQLVVVGDQEAMVEQELTGGDRPADETKDSEVSK